jgi:CheY-like chemotaxis protein
LIDDLLDVARITQGRITLRKEHVYVARIVARAVESTGSLIESRSVHLTVSLPAEPLRVEADPARLEQVFVNLLSNAAKYTEMGGSIDVIAERQGQEVTIRVRDTGVGIAPEMLAHIWELFAQSGQTLDRAQGGLGIGLTVARRLVELHGARIEAYSDGLGQGAEFVVTFPLLPPTTDETHAVLPSGSIPHARILVVEDNVDVAESLTILLELLGHQVRAVCDAIAALEAARADIPDVMLVDIGLPGWTVMRLLGECVEMATSSTLCW